MKTNHTKDTPEVDAGIEEIKGAMALDFAHLDEADWQKVLSYVALLEQNHHHQLQKARHDWLREEIVRLKELKEKQIEHRDGCPHTFNQKKACNCGAKINNKINKALQTIIDRYQKELDQDKK